MSSRGLASLLAVPPTLRPALLQAAIAAPYSPFALAQPTGPLPSQTQSRHFTKQKRRKPSEAPKTSSPSRSHTPSRPSKPSRPSRPIWPSKPSRPSRLPKAEQRARAASTSRAAAAASPKKVSLSKKAPVSGGAPPLPRNSSTSRTAPTSKAPSVSRAVSTPKAASASKAASTPLASSPPSDRLKPPPVLSFLPTPSTTTPPRALLSALPSNNDLTRTTALLRLPKFLYSAPRFLNLPVNTRTPEICLLGRSNVGKSTLINALGGYGGKRAGFMHGVSGTRSGLAITSAQAGCTKTMNAYGFGPPLSVPPLTRRQQEARKEAGRSRSVRRGAGASIDVSERMPRHSLILMDMPGYGQNSREDWGKEILKYLNRREILRGAVLLIDAVAGVKPGDRSVLEVLRDAGLKTSVVLTKADKLVPDPNPAVWRASGALSEACLHVWQEIRRVERQSETTDWFEGDGWTPEIFVTGAGDPRTGGMGMGVDGAGLAICRLAGHIAEPERKLLEPQPEIVPFDQLVYTTTSTPVAPRREAPPAERAGRDQSVFTTATPRSMASPVLAEPREEASVSRPATGRVQRAGRKTATGRARVGTSRRMEGTRARSGSERADPFDSMRQTMSRPQSGREFGRASF